MVFSKFQLRKLLGVTSFSLGAGLVKGLGDVGLGSPCGIYVGGLLGPV